MDHHEFKITICMGSSCFSRGNKRILHVIQDYIRETGISGRVVFTGSHCIDKCVEGPLIKINDVLYSNVDENNVIGFIEAFFETKQSK